MITLQILKSMVTLFLFWSIYKLFLEKETAFIFNRIYLLSSPIIAIILPLINLNLEHQTPIYLTFTPIVNENTLFWTLSSIYVLGIFIYSLRFILELFRLFNLIRKGQNSFISNTNILLTKEKTQPFSFLKYIIVNEKDIQTEKFNDLILLHEQTHVDQNHSLDILFLECVRIFFWFNPAIHFIIQSAKLNHEFLADKAVIDKNDSKIKQYQELLLSFSSQPSIQISSAVNYKVTKKRFLKMKQKTNNQMRKVVPLGISVAGIMFIILFSITNLQQSSGSGESSEHHSTNSEHSS